MPIHVYKCPKCSREEDKLSGVVNDDLHCTCGVLMKKQFTPCGMVVLNRSKPGSFKYDVKENDAHKDMINSFKLQEEKGGPQSQGEKEDTDYWHTVLKDKL